MTATCEHCGSAACVRNGDGVKRLPYLDGGRVAYRDSPVTRMRCRACGRSGRAYDGTDVAAEAALREHVVERFFHLGQEGTTLETGMPTSTVHRHLQAWVALREPDVALAEPDGLLLECVRMRKGEGLLVIDMERRTLVDMLDGRAALAAWLDLPTRAPALEACVPLDPGIVAVLRERVPSTRLMVAPTALAAAVGSTVAQALRALRRRPDMQGRNGMPTPAEMAEALEGGRPHEGWPGEAVALFLAARLAFDLCSCPSREAAERLWPEFALAASDRPCRSLSILMQSWRSPFMEGLGRPDVEATAALAERIRAGLDGRRPVLGDIGLRAYALMRDFERRSVASPFPGRPSMPVSVGTCLEGLARRLGV